MPSAYFNTELSTDVNSGDFYAGKGTIAGTVAIDDDPDIPVRRRVRLHLKVNGVLLKETWSDPVTGAYSFTNLRVGALFYVIAFDHTGTHNAVIKDSITPE